MKKTLVSFLSIFVISLFSIGCNITVQEQDLLDRPDTILTSAGVGVSISRLSQETKYINIYRKDITSSSDEDAEVVHIGVLYPGVFNENDKTYFYEDLYLYSGHKYKYMIRYCEPEGFFYSAWTDVVQIPVTLGYSDSTNLSYKSSNTKFTYNKNDLTLTFRGAVSEPDIPNFVNEWTPVLAVSSDSATQVFNLTSVSDGAIINLRGLLSQDFYDKEITILGILAQKIIYAEPESGSTVPREKMIFWTPLTEIKIQGYSGNIIQISSETGSTGYDYSY